eukprot:jgi/Tetstr1/429455/TSEL_019363.t1
MFPPFAPPEVAAGSTTRGRAAKRFGRRAVEIISRLELVPSVSPDASEVEAGDTPPAPLAGCSLIRWSSPAPDRPTFGNPLPRLLAKVTAQAWWLSGALAHGWIHYGHHRARLCRVL